MLSFYVETKETIRREYTRTWVLQSIEQAFFLHVLWCTNQLIISENKNTMEFDVMHKYNKSIP